MFTSSPGTTLSLGSQGIGSVQDVLSFRMGERVNLQIFILFVFFFLVLKRDISILLMLRKSETNDPTKSQSCFSENVWSINCYVFMGERRLDLICYNVFSTLTTD